MAQNPSRIEGRIHNAKRCTFDGRDCWIAAIHDAGTGAFVTSALNVQEVASPKEGKLWLLQRASAMGLPLAKISVTP